MQIFIVLKHCSKEYANNTLFKFHGVSEKEIKNASRGHFEMISILKHLHIILDLMVLFTRMIWMWYWPSVLKTPALFGSIDCYRFRVPKLRAITFKLLIINTGKSMGTPNSVRIQSKLFNFVTTKSDK